MPNFGARSLQELSTCDDRLQKLFKEVIKNFDCSIICGQRGQKEQDEAFRTGKSKLKFPNSKHNGSPSLAVDVVPCVNGKIDWNNTKLFHYFAGYVMGVASQMGINLRWGGDFNRDKNLSNDTFLDAPHFELD